MLLLAAVLMLLAACGKKPQTEPEPDSGIENSTASVQEVSEPSPAAQAEAEAAPSVTAEAEASPSAAEEAASSAAEPEPEVPADEITGGASKEEAQLLAFNTLYHGKYTEGEVWISFATGAKEDVLYSVTLENLTAGSGDLDGYLLDEEGNGIKAAEQRNGDNWFDRAVRAKQDGTADTAVFNSLAPGTTYYLRLQGESKAEYSLRITDPEEAPFDTAAGKVILSENDEFAPAANQDEAPLLIANRSYRGKYMEGYQWIAFRTGEKEDVPYSVTLENLTVGSGDLDGYLVDEYGFGIKADVLRNGDNWYLRSVRAKQDGTADTAVFNSLAPGTTYYLRLQGESKAEYILTVSSEEVTSVPEASITEVEGFVTLNSTDEPGTSQSFALNIPLETKVSAKYTGGYAWLAFTTNEAEGAEYYLTLINCSVGSEDLDGYLVDKSGNGLSAAELRNGDNWYKKAVSAKQDGRADTAMFSNLAPDTTYYLRLQGKGKAEYTFCVYSPSVSNENQNVTSSSLSEVIGELDENAVFTTGTNQNIATLLKKNTRYRGNYEEGYSWVSFTTGPEENAEYSVTLENLTVGSEPLDGYLVDKYGRSVKAAQLRNGDNRYGKSVRAKEDGTADTAVFDSLQPDTTYYLWLNGKSKAEYILMIGAPEKEETENTIAEEPAEEVIFKVPFELNETQVRFVANKAEFIDEEAAKEALAPVAELILAHPEDRVLLAGTTAHFGDNQASCEELSGRRADAVKDLLVNFFGVPESQLVTAGLGYEKDPFVRGRDIDENGNFVETEGAKNRRVVVVAAESEVGRSILG